VVFVCLDWVTARTDRLTDDILGVGQFLGLTENVHRHRFGNNDHAVDVPDDDISGADFHATDDCRDIPIQELPSRNGVSGSSELREHWEVVLEYE
jgi:hypothetical protein